MQKIVPFLWFDKEAGEAAKFYASVFPNSKIKKKTLISDTPSGNVEVIDMEIYGQDFSMMSAGPYFKLNPSISFFVYCEAKEIDNLWEKLSKNGKVLMEFGKYPFSEKYGWCEDKFGVSWQLFIGKNAQRIAPAMMFIGKNNGKAEKAMKFYTSVFDNSKIEFVSRYEKGAGDNEGNISHAAFLLDGQKFIAMDSGMNHKFNFNEAVSFIVNCKDQKEIDYYWKKLSAVPESEQCGWLKDKFGVSWQITPIGWEKMMDDKDKKKVARATQAMLKMKKLDIKKLEDAFEGK